MFISPLWTVKYNLKSEIVNLKETNTEKVDAHIYRKECMPAMLEYSF